MPLGWRIIYCTIIIFSGFKLFMWSLEDYKEESFLSNFLESILHLVTGSFELSAIGGLLGGLLFMILGVVLLIFGG